VCFIICLAVGCLYQRKPLSANWLTGVKLLRSSSANISVALKEKKISGARRKLRAAGSGEEKAIMAVNQPVYLEKLQ
jgi:hypothetical protein